MKMRAYPEKKKTTTQRFADPCWPPAEGLTYIYIYVIYIYSIYIYWNKWVTHLVAKRLNIQSHQKIQNRTKSLSPNISFGDAC